MRQILPDLWQTETEKPAPGLTTHADLLTRAEGIVLSSAFADDPGYQEIVPADWDGLVAAAIAKLN